MKIKRSEGIHFFSAGEIKKGWGHEVTVVNNDVIDCLFPTGYSGKLLVYNKQYALSSMHYHSIKHETFYVLEGKFRFTYYDLEQAIPISRDLQRGDVVVIPPCNPHQVLCLTSSGTIIEFASTDYGWDNFRIAKGDSQTK